MRVEGSAADSMEQFALPIVAAICSMLPPIFTFIGTLFDHQLGSMELVPEPTPSLSRLGGNPQILSLERSQPADPLSSLCPQPAGPLCAAIE